MSAPVTTCPTRVRLAEHDRHRLPASIALHLLPGVAFTGGAFLLARAATGRGLPPVLGFLAGDLLVLIPVQLGIVALAARRRTGSWSLGGGLRYTRRLPRRQLAVISVATLAWAGLVFVATAPAADALRVSMFSWMPAELDLTAHLTQPQTYPRGTLVAAWAAGFVLTTVAVPIVEEIYFRGFLLPRLEHLGWLAPVINTTLFALYHLWSPWQAPTRIVATLPVYYLVWRKRSIWPAVVVHVALNFIGDTVAGVPALLR